MTELDKDLTGKIAEIILKNSPVQADLTEFEASLVCKASSRIARTVTKRNCLKNRKTKAKTPSPGVRMLSVHVCSLCVPVESF